MEEEVPVLAVCYFGGVKGAVCVRRHNALYQNSKSAIKPVLVTNCGKAAIHWFSMARASAGGMLKAIEVKFIRQVQARPPNRTEGSGEGGQRLGTNNIPKRSMELNKRRNTSKRDSSNVTLKEFGPEVVVQ